MPEAASLPLFPLHTVLVPGAALELRIFERRYLDMVRAGEEVTVTDHGKAVARLVPLDRPRQLDVLIAEGLVTPARAVKRPRGDAPIKARGTVSDLLADERR